ncbi:MAG: nuclear transport factor 2 family protein [Cytophagales bacterium]|nr:nuclear transport factor 2 family protein [Cytophagales bacterium]
MANSPLPRWHELVEKQDISIFDEIFHDDCVFYSPLVFQPKEGKALTKQFLSAAARMFNEAEHFTYVKEVVDEQSAVLVFHSKIEGIFIEGIDMITWDEQGLITEFKVFIRPMKGIMKVAATMQKQLGLKGPTFGQRLKMLFSGG